MSYQTLLCRDCSFSLSILAVAFACICRQEEFCRKAYITGKSFQMQLLGDNRSLFAVCCFRCSSMGAHCYRSGPCMCSFFFSSFFGIQGEFCTVLNVCLFIHLPILSYLLYCCTLCWYQLARLCKKLEEKSFLFVFFFFPITHSGVCHC